MFLSSKLSGCKKKQRRLIYKMSGGGWANLQGKCSGCKNIYYKNKLTSVNGELYCDQCKIKLKKNIMRKCAGCGDEFKEGDMERYKKKWYCSSCNENEQKRAKSKSVASRKSSASIESNISEDEIQKIVNERLLVMKNEILQELIGLIQVRQPYGNVSTNTGTVSLENNSMMTVIRILTKISMYDLNTIIELLKNKYDMKKFEDENVSFYYSMDNVKREKEITGTKNNPQPPIKYKLARLFNRIARKDGDMYRTLLNAFKNMIIHTIRDEFGIESDDCDDLDGTEMNVNDIVEKITEDDLKDLEDGYSDDFDLDFV